MTESKKKPSGGAAKKAKTTTKKASAKTAKAAKKPAKTAAAAKTKTETSAAPASKARPAAASPGMIQVKLVRSLIGSSPHQRAVVAGLGLRKLNHTVQRKDTREIRGMVAKVPHLVSILD